MKPKFKASSFSILETSVQFIMVDYIEAAIAKRQLLRAYINQLDAVRQEEIRNSTAFVVKIKPRLGGCKYFIIVKSTAEDKHLAHEAVHLAMRILGQAPYTIEAKEEELIAQAVEAIFDNMREMFHRFLKTWDDVTG